ncbi:histidine decarboxylase [Sabethes cyaneus]|uniref:histidine decarboxylase n=1 Tax=Sabethes cyaneus TaxID=53552 RepID=UPI00237D552F|nr:histidine decarboxylase [Sabethes cyaneus]
MDFDEYRKRGKEMVDYIADYLETIRERRVLPDVKPGYMRNLLPDSAPLEGEPWQTIIDDVERVIMPGVTHWQSPHMHAYFPALNSFPSLLGDMLADAINCLGFTWASSPACTELESIVMNWLGKMIGLPDEFLHIPGVSHGGGVIQTTASEATLVCLLAGRTLAIRRFHEHTPGQQDAEINARLVAYCSDQAHSSVEKAALIGLVRMRFIEADDGLSLGGRALEEAINEDIKQGLIPFWVCATLGTTGACAFDNLQEVGEVCARYKIWLHVDAAYAGSAFICPEFRIWLKGINRADSIAFNPSKWLMVHFDCTAMWVKNSGALHRTFNVEPLYLQHENSGLAIDYMHWQIPLSKRFRALKLWFVLRSFGIKGLQKHIREGVRLAQKFEALVLADHRFEIPAVRHLGMVVFRIRGENHLTEKLLKRLNHRGNLHAVPASLKGKYVIRFTVTSTRTTSEDILKDWYEIKTVTGDMLEELNVKIADRSRVPLRDTREKNEAFGSSLLLANSPMSPKIVNGSFAAIFDADEFLAKVYAGVRISNQDSPAMRRRVRGILMSGKQFSLDSRMDLVVQGISPGEVKNGIESKAITEDCEEVWEACEQMEVVDQEMLFMTLFPSFLLPIPLPYRTPPPTPRRQFRSQSVDVGMIQVQTNAANSLQNLLSKPTARRSEPYFSTDSLDQAFTLPSLASSNASSAKASYESNLDSIDENRSLHSYRASSLSKRRCSDSSHLFSLTVPNAYPEKRQSEPMIRCAFYNKSFDIMCPKPAGGVKRVLSQNDIARRPFRRQISTINEIITDEAILLDGRVVEHDWKKLNLIAPKFQCCISDEHGQCINFDPVYHNHDPQLNVKDILRKTLQFEENFVEKFEQVCPQMDALNDRKEREPERKCRIGTRCDDEVIYENVKICRKCGHCTVRL